MDKLVIEGGVPLQGEVQITGAKNAALPILAATLLAPGVHQLFNVPHLMDLRTAKRLLGLMGVGFEEGEPLLVDTSRLTGWMAPYETVKTMRAAVLVLGPLVARLGQASISLPGGCALGARPIDLHLKGLQAMGVKITLNQGYVEAKVKRLRGAEINLDLPTVTGTENLLMAAVLAQGVTRIHNAAREPEVSDLAQFLTAMGAKIEGIGTDVLTITGVSDLRPAPYTIIPDRLEAATLLAAAAITRGQVTITGAPVDFLGAALEKFQEAGVNLQTTADRIMVEPSGRLRGVDLITLPYPGFPTDVQPQFMALTTLARGTSVIVETIFENRFMSVSELRRLGADITLTGKQAVVRGVKYLQGAPVMSTDIRASAALVVAGLAAQGTTEVHRIYHLDRGYAHFTEKLARLGARVRRLPA